jgi:formate hydrogenlyase subunit 6/NADH:ubiquinone oxidoreductase subunit I
MADKKIIKVEDIKTEAEKEACPVQQALYYVTEFLAGPMCAKCFPCSMGSYEAKQILTRITEGTGTATDIMNLKRISSEMLESSMCKKGKDTARFMLEWLDTDVFTAHLEGTCPDKSCRAFVEYRIVPDKCTLCGICKNVCKYNAIFGEKAAPFKGGYYPFEIRQTKCVKCGDCIHVCPEGAIVLLDLKVKEPAGV